jgi:L-amino acid N-acyltransferase YncA
MMTVKPLEEAHYPVVKKIYEMGIATGHATFQAEAPGWESWDRSHRKTCRLVMTDEQDQVIGWAALTPVSDRCVYGGVAEVSVYIDSRFRGKGIGKKLLESLIHESEKENLWTLQAGIFPENKASIALHEQCGFRQIGYREKIGQMKGLWRDTILMERRSKIAGV